MFCATACDGCVAYSAVASAEPRPTTNKASAEATHASTVVRRVLIPDPSPDGRAKHSIAKAGALYNLTVSMNRLVCTALLSFALTAALVPGAASARAGFRGEISPISRALRAHMTGVSWHRGCPVPLSNLRLLTLSYRGFDQRSHTGRLVVNKNVAKQVVAVFRNLFGADFPIRRMQLVDAYGGSDFRSIEADNTSAFNCRVATGSTSWSNHAYGLAIDINPIENPYVTASGSAAHRASRPYLNRSQIRRGMAYPGGVLVGTFSSIGWGWGGYWSGDRDYQHFSSNGR
jgi:hypothetical protein